ncbi:MAG: Gfo/Idh/MocA family oxidoreductase [Planctomycetes bacterium]|nr:Gfo/Idh/MocA family oxidoreductase [Planctomycetota bacterium]
MKQCNVGIIGFGFIGKVHAYGYINLPLFYDPLPLEAKITHVCTSRTETAEKGAALIGADNAVTDFRKITENPDVDIVHICTPNHLHKDALLSAMEHNKHIYCDKPLVATFDEAMMIQEALDEYTATAQMTLQNRFFPATMRAKQLIDEGFIGKVLEFRGCYLHSGSADPKAPLKWKLSGAAGGGVIADLGTHILDLLHWLLGDYDRLLATTRIAYPQRPALEDPSRMVKVDAEDCVMILAEMCSGAIGNIEATKIATGAEDELRFEIHGSKGALRFNGTDAHHLEAYDAGAPDSPIGGSRGWIRIDTGQRYPQPATKFPGPKFTPGWIRSHMACLANFLQSVANDEPGRPGLKQGIYLQRLIECCRQSAGANEWGTV